ncbi:hypothetical protein CA265_01790 [Sphingobacteriaceae bacterium GW460-11-11-14-LB5]|nr:hypothetical protein CA265_01790 [Sphingobacteriaceae bacterium GW460-11-11-14-LB5]
MKLFSKKKKQEDPGEFWSQKVELTKIMSKYDYFKATCSAKNILHFGCTDWPIFDPATNLHIWLAGICKELSGFDIDVQGLAELQKHVNQPYFSDFAELSDKKFDVCLVPETIEHVENIGTFLSSLGKVNAEKFIITGPNCFAPEHMSRNIASNNLFVEIVHPDHNCWFSPFTLKNVITKYANLKVDHVYLLEDETMVCCECTKV